MKKLSLGLVIALFTGGLTVFAASVLFSDVKGTEWFAPSLQRNVEKGIISGYSDNTFRPTDTPSRAELSAVTDRAINYMRAQELAFEFLKWSNRQKTPQTVSINNQQILISEANFGGYSPSKLAQDGIKNLANIIATVDENMMYRCIDELSKNNGGKLNACASIGTINTQNTEFAEF